MFLFCLLLSRISKLLPSKGEVHNHARHKTIRTYYYYSDHIATAISYLLLLLYYTAFNFTTSSYTITTTTRLLLWCRVTAVVIREIIYI